MLASCCIIGWAQGVLTNAYSAKVPFTDFCDLRLISADANLKDNLLTSGNASQRSIGRTNVTQT